MWGTCSKQVIKTHDIAAELRITIIACLWNWNNHSASTREIRIEIWALGQNIFSPQFPRPSPKFWKIANFKSAISPLLELQMRWLFFETAYFWKRNSDMQSVSSDFVQKVSEIDQKVTAPEKISHLCQGKCSDTRCGEPPAIKNENAWYDRNIGEKRDFIDRRPLWGGYLFWATSIKINSWIFSLESTLSYIISLI